MLYFVITGEIGQGWFFVEPRFGNGGGGGHGYERAPHWEFCNGFSAHGEFWCIQLVHTQHSFTILKFRRFTVDYAYGEFCTCGTFDNS